MSSQDDPRHPIAAVARRTGLSQQVLRAWERRYEVVVPQRTPTGRRLYTERDLETLTLIKRLIDAGYRIGSLQERTLPELREMAAAEMRQDAAPSSLPDSGADSVALLDAALAAVASLEPERLEEVLRQASVSLSRPALRSLFLHPLLLEIGHRWQTGELRIAHEHMASAIIRSFLASLHAERRTAVGSARIVAATTPGQHHELGLLLATSHLMDLGWEVTYLGPDLPVAEITAAVRKLDARAVLLSFVYPSGDPQGDAALRELSALAPETCELIVGGQGAPAYADAIVAAGAHLVADLDALEDLIQRLDH